MNIQVQIVMIAAMTNGMHVIGRDGAIPWKLDTDMGHFRAATKGQIVVMGKKTWLSLPKRPLPGRLNIVMTHHPRDIESPAIGVSSVRQVVAIAEREIMNDPEPKRKLMVIGGHDIYKAFLPYAKVLLLTHVHALISGDTYFPDIPWELWERAHGTPYPSHQGEDYTDEYPFEIVRYVRK